MTNMLKTLIEKVVNMQDRMGNINKEIETLGKFQKKMLKSERMTKMKTVFDELTSRLGTAKKE